MFDNKWIGDIKYYSLPALSTGLLELNKSLCKTNNDFACELTAYARRTYELEDQMGHVKRALLNAGIITQIR